MAKTRSNNTVPTTEDIYTISRLNHEVRQLLEEVFPVVWVEGEISNLAKPASGHFYFTLKDDNAQVRCAFFKNRNINLKIVGNYVKRWFRTFRGSLSVDK